MIYWSRRSGYLSLHWNLLSFSFGRDTRSVSILMAAIMTSLPNQGYWTLQVMSMWTFPHVEKKRDGNASEDQVQIQITTHVHYIHYIMYNTHYILYYSPYLLLKKTTPVSQPLGKAMWDNVELCPCYYRFANLILFQTHTIFFRNCEFFLQ